MVRRVVIAITIFTTVFLHGCQNAPSAEKEPSTNAVPLSHEAANHDHAAHEHVAVPDYSTNFAKLNREDVAAARLQQMCPVSDEPLGSMGVPLKIQVNGQEVWVCCEDCRASLLAKPGDYLSKLKLPKDSPTHDHP